MYSLVLSDIYKGGTAGEENRNRDDQIDVKFSGIELTQKLFGEYLLEKGTYDAFDTIDAKIEQNQ